MAEPIRTLLFIVGIAALICSFAGGGIFLVRWQWRRLRSYLIHKIESQITPDERTSCRWLLLGIELFSMIAALAVFSIGVNLAVSPSVTLSYLGASICALAFPCLAGASLCAGTVARIDKITHNQIRRTKN